MSEVNAVIIKGKTNSDPLIKITTPLYEKLGFKEVGRRPKYYQNPREDALILRKEWEL